MGLGQGLPNTWLLALYAREPHGSSSLLTEPQDFSESPGFCEVGTTMVIISGMLPPADSRGEYLAAPHSSLMQGAAKERHRERTLEAWAGSCSVWRST